MNVAEKMGIRQQRLMLPYIKYIIHCWKNDSESRFNTSHYEKVLSKRQNPMELNKPNYVLFRYDKDKEALQAYSVCLEQLGSWKDWSSEDITSRKPIY